MYLSSVSMDSRLPFFFKLFIIHYCTLLFWYSNYSQWELLNSCLKLVTNSRFHFGLGHFRSIQAASFRTGFRIN